MKTVILIATPFGLENNIPDIKKEIVRYVGNRLVRDNPTDAPMLEVYNTLDDEDKEQISKIATGFLDNAAVFLIECDNDDFGNAGNLCTLEPKDKPYM
jgi:hypothetical protein